MKSFYKCCLVLCIVSLFFGCQSTEPTVSDEEMKIKPSLHVEIPNTESSVVTEPQPMRDDLTALELVKLMGNGINLGNTMEAYRSTSLGTKKDPQIYEQLWGQPVTTQKLMDSYKAAGFDCIRIPVAWTNAMDYENGDYTINTPYLDRVETIVNYALNAGLYVVFNDHWDGGWWGMFGSKNLDTRADALELYTKMWTQIAVRFKNYSDYVIFEGGNEEIGNRLNDANVCYDSGMLSQDECYESAKMINQTFVDVVRGTGGNNAKRFLLIPGYNTDIAMTCDDRFAMPKDTVKDKLLLSVHYYTPWNFCGGSSVTNWGTKPELSEMNKNLAQMQKFTEQGYGIVIGEWAAGAMEDGSKKPDSIGFYQNFLDNCAIYNYTSMLWDCSTFYIRTQYGFPDQEIADVFLAYSIAEESKMSEEAWMDAAGARISERLSNAPETRSDNEFVNQDSKAVAWLMFQSSDYQISYSVGDKYNPDSITDGLVATDVEITGEGTYTVGLDFTGCANGGGKARSFTFSALAIANGEQLFPNYVIDFKEIVVNGKKYPCTKKPYTTSDDGKCTRVNLINEWVTSINKKTARTLNGDKEGISAVLVTKGDPELKEMKDIYITFYYGPGSSQE